MKCKYCGSTNTELVRVYKRHKKSNSRTFVYDCNSCDSVSEYMGIPDDEMHVPKNPHCEMCGTEMLPNMLNDHKTGLVVAVHVCPNCGLVKRE